MLRERNVSKAAHRVGMTQPTMSHLLARLRQTFGDPLLVRGSAGLTLTDTGALLIQTAEVAEADLVPRLQAIAAERRSPRIYLRADGQNAWTRVAQVMGALNAGGFSDIGLVTDAGGPRMGAPTPADG